MKEALELALEALWTTANPKAEEAITAIKEALAQPEPLPYMHSQWQETIAGIPVTFESEADAKRFLTTQPAQEPVAWLDEEKKIIYWHNTHETDDYHGFRRTTPLYTTSPAQPEERNFCSRCGKRTADLTMIHTCTPPQENT
jgi:hypothetical protein